MSIINKKSIFTAMLQDGPFSIGDLPSFSAPFSLESREWVRKIRDDSLMKTKYRAVRNQIFDFVNVNSFDEILPLVLDKELRKNRIKSSHQLLGNMFGIQGGTVAIDRYFLEYARTADAVVNSLRAKVLAPYSTHIETTNEIEALHDPLYLLLVIFDDRYHRKARFEAKRKLVLMGLAGTIEQRERETRVEQKFVDFLDFLNGFVWSPIRKIGDLEICFLHSIHDPKEFRCTDVKVLTEAEALKIKLTAGEKLTIIKRRRFLDQGGEVPVYVTVRRKLPAAKVLKLLRKNEKNPAVAVDDELGLMAVLNSVSDVKRFLRHLTKSAVRAESFMSLEDISDTLTGGDYEGTATGSSAKTPMLKFFARLGGMRVEFIIHTNRSYLNYMNQRDVAHDEYEVKRIFDTGVAEFLFPSDIYKLDLENIRSTQLASFRKSIEKY